MIARGRLTDLAACHRTSWIYHQLFWKCFGALVTFADAQVYRVWLTASNKKFSQ